LKKDFTVVSRLPYTPQQLIGLSVLFNFNSVGSNLAFKNALVLFGRVDKIRKPCKPMYEALDE
jgi:hypothetical protein